MRSKDTQFPGTGSAGDGRSAMSRLRLLDFDDLFLLSHLLDGSTIAATAKQLGLTQPAITQRVRKIERVFDEAILQKAGRHVRLTPAGRAICVKAADALGLMRTVAAEPTTHELMIGAAPAISARWLFPAIRALHEQPEQRRQLFHCHAANTEELPQLIESGMIAACLTSGNAPSSTVYGVIDIGEEDYVMVASPDVAAQVKTVEDLGPQMLLELDRSFPLLTRVETAARAVMRFRDVWFLGVPQNLLAAVLAGYGVAVLPGDMVRGQVASGKLEVLLPELDVMPERFRLVYRKDPAIEPMALALAKALTAQRKDLT